MFAQPESIGVKPWARFAQDGGVTDTAAFSHCLADRAADAIVARDSLAAVKLGVNATPSFLINGQLISGNPGLNQLNEYVKAALKKGS